MYLSFFQIFHNNALTFTLGPPWHDLPLLRQLHDIGLSHLLHTVLQKLCQKPVPCFFVMSAEPENAPSLPCFLRSRGKSLQTPCADAETGCTSVQTQCASEENI